MADLVGEIAAQRQQSNLSSALRLYVLRFYLEPESTTMRTARALQGDRRFRA